MQRTLDAIREHDRAIAAFGVPRAVIATSALRRAQNAGVFANRVRDATGCSLEILSGEEEARCSYRGALALEPLNENGRYGVLDVGGGSTEYAWGDSAAPEGALSCEIGAVRLTHEFPELRGEARLTGELLSRARDRAKEMLEPLSGAASSDCLIVVGGTGTTAVAMAQSTLESQAWSSAMLDREALHMVAERIARSTLAERRRLAGLHPQRADIILGGLIVLDEAYALLHRESALVSRNDLLLGYLLSRSA